MEEMRELVPAALYARVSSDRQDVDLSVSAHLRALRDHAGRQGCVVKGEYVDEAESGLIVRRPQFQEMLHEASRPNAPFRVILMGRTQQQRKVSVLMGCRSEAG